jgi:hypothetical protein
MELAPLANLYPSSIKPDFAPMNSNSVKLEAGKISLSEIELGVPVDSRALLGEEEKPPPPPPTQQQASAGTMPKATKIKLGFKKN